MAKQKKDEKKKAAKTPAAAPSAQEASAQEAKLDEPAERQNPERAAKKRLVPKLDAQGKQVFDEDGKPVFVEENISYSETRPASPARTHVQPTQALDRQLELQNLKVRKQSNICQENKATGLGAG